MRTNWLCRWMIVFLGDRWSSSRGGCLSHWSQSLSLSVILTFWNLSVIFLTYFCHLSVIFISISYPHHSVLLPFCLFVFVSSSEEELLIWNRSSWNLTHFKGRTYQAEELESSQEAGTQAWTAKCWRRLDELCTSSYSWCWRIDESVHIRLGGGTCHSFRFGSIDKLMIWNDSSSLWHVMTNKVEFHASKALSTLSASCF